MRRYFLPVLSGVLLALALYPFALWPLALVALAPLFYFLSGGVRGKKETFFGGVVTGMLAVAPTLYWSLLQLSTQPGAEALTYAVRWSSIFFLLFIGALFGSMALAYRALRGCGPLLDSLLAAALYTVVELVLFAIFGGYYYGSLAHALTPFPLALIIASLGGAPLVVFAAAWISAILARRSWRLALGVFLALAGISAGAFWYGQSYKVTGPSLPVAVIQREPQSLLYVTAPAPEPFGDYGLQLLISEAARGGEAALVVYPYSPVEAVYAGARPAIKGLRNLAPQSAMGAWLKTFAPASTTVLLWNTAAERGNLYDSFDFWKDGTQQTYQKHVLYPLSDYTPPLLRPFGFSRVPYPVTSGTANAVVVAGVRIGGLVCSELQKEGYVRSQASVSDVLLSVGFDGFFPGRYAALWALQAARLRAAENGVPLIRSHIFGPSALIWADGSVGEVLPYGAVGVLRGSITIEKIPTLYARSGPWPVYVFLAALLLYFLIARVKDNSKTR